MTTARNQSRNWNGHRLSDTDPTYESALELIADLVVDFESVPVIDSGGAVDSDDSVGETGGGATPSLAIPKCRFDGSVLGSLEGTISD